MAALAAFDIAKELRQANMANVKLLCYTFGAPRVGNHAFAKEYDQLVQDSWNVINDQVSHCIWLALAHPSRALPCVHLA